MDAQNQQPFPNDTEAESCNECGGDGLVTRGLGGGYFEDECGACDGTGRADGWVPCEECGETTFDHGGPYNECQACRLAEWEAEKERLAVEAFDAAYERAMRRADHEAALAEDAHERMLEGM